MRLTKIDFEKDALMFKTLAEELSLIVNSNTVKKGGYKSERFENLAFTKRLTFHYGVYRIVFEKVVDSTLKIDIAGDLSSKLNTEETRKVYTLLLNTSEAFLKKKKVNIFISLSFYCFSKNEVSMDEMFGPYNFTDFERGKTATPLSKSLKDLQELAFYLKDYFPIKHNGKCIETGTNKFRKIYNIELMNDEGTAKIAVFHDEFPIFVLSTKEEVENLIHLKKVKMKELEEIKKDAIKELTSHDPSLYYDGKNGVTFLESKAAINTEYDVFKNEYLMVFLKSKVKASTIEEVDKKIQKLIIKKTK